MGGHQHLFEQDALLSLVDALASLGLEVRLMGDGAFGGDRGADLVVDPYGLEVPVALKRHSLVTPEVAKRLLERPRPPEVVLIVIADRVTDEARSLLLDRQAGYYDLRGRLALRSKRLMLDIEVPAVGARNERVDALAGPAGREIAAAILMRPEESHSVRGLARELHRAPSTVSDVLAALRRSDLLDESNALAGSGLFWQLAARWTAPRTFLTQIPLPGVDNNPRQPLGLNRFDVEDQPGWALTDTVAAAVLGAPIAASSGQVHDFFVPSDSIVRRAITLLGPTTSPQHARCSVRVAPVPAACSHRLNLANNPTEWPLAHPVFVALDLAQDEGRGREILESWNLKKRWARVW